MNDGYRKQRDPITGQDTAIRSPQEGYRAPSGHEGAPANGFDFPAAVRRREAEKTRAITAAAARIGRFLECDDPSLLSDYIGTLLTGNDLSKLDLPAEAAGTLVELRNIIPIISLDPLEALPKDDTSTEADAVYFDAAGGAVYKRYKIEEGIVTQGIQPGRMSGNASDGWSFLLLRHTPLLTYLQQIDATNRQGHIVFTEIAGMTDEGDLVVKQPYVRGLVRAVGESEDIVRKLTVLDMSLVPSPPEFEPAAVTKISREFYVMIDLHDENVMQDADGRVFLIDAATRPLTRDEVRKLGLNADPDPSPLPS